MMILESRVTNDPMNIKHIESGFVAKLSSLNLVFLQVIALFSFHCSGIAVPSVQVVSPSNAQAVARVALSGIEAPMILQGSSDLFNWKDLMVVTPAFNGIGADVNADVLVTKSFYRLVGLEEPLRLYPNTFRGSAHLAKIVSGRRVEINIFGTRDEEGYPEAVTSITYRVGDTQYVSTNSPPPPVTDSTISRSTSATSFVALERYCHGTVFVDLSGDCWPSKSIPVVRFSAEQQEVGSNLVHEISGELPCKLERVIANPNRAEYSYQAPFWFVYPQEVDDMKVSDSIGKMMEFSHGPAADGMGIVIGLAVVAGVTTLPANVFLFAITAVTCGVIGYAEYSRVDSPFDYSKIKDPLTATKLSVTAMIPNGESHSLATSPTVTLNNPTEGSQIPDITLTDLCDQAVHIVAHPTSPTQHHLRNKFQYYNNGRTAIYGGFTDLVNIDGLSYISKVDDHRVPTRGFGTAKITFSPTSSVLKFVSEIMGCVESSGAETIVTSDGKLIFKIVRGNGNLPKKAYDVEFKSWGSSGGGMLTKEQYIYFTQPANKTSILSLESNTVFGLTYTARIYVTSRTPQTDKSGVALTIMGEKRNTQLLDRYFTR